MASLETSHHFQAPREQVFAGVGRFSEYPKYIPGVTKIEVFPASSQGTLCRVRYELNLVKKFYYTLDMFADAPKRIWWELVESNLMKKNSGSWQFSESADGTDAIYKLDVDFKGLVPKSVTNKVAKANLPGMFSGMEKLIIDTKVES